jgi:hypothetical protein
LGLRPNVFRVDENTIWLGGRLRTAFDFDGLNHQTKKEKVADLNKSDAIKLLRKEFPGLDWETGSLKRCSTTVGILIAAGSGDSASFKALWDEVDFIGALLDGIQVKVKRPLSGVKGLKEPKTQVMNELTKRYEAQMSNLFYGSEEEGIKLHEDVLGDISNLLNQSAKRGYQSSQQAFLKKVQKEQAKAIA